MPTISAILITRNEERNVADCLAALSWADEIVVLDSYSTDRTVEVCRRLTDKVHQRTFVNFPTQRNAALELATSDWAFFVDADERASAELAAEIRAVVSKPGDNVGYWVPRKNIIWGKWIKGGGWFPDHQLRLLRRGKARYDDAQEVHEVMRLDGPAGYLHNLLLHYNYQSVRQFLRKQDEYASLHASTLYHAGTRPRLRAYITQPLRQFLGRYFVRRGYRDGLHGFVLAALLAYYQFLAHWRLRRLWRR